MKIKLYYNTSLSNLEREMNEMLEQLKKENLYVQDVDIKFQRGNYENEYVGIIKYQETVEEKIVGQWFDMNKNCLD